MNNFSNSSINYLSNRRCYLDLDGTIGDFDNHFFNLWGEYPRNVKDEQLWQNIASHPEFWITMPKMDYADTLVDYISKTGLPFCILTGCPKTEYDWAAENKVKWINKHFGDIEVITCLSKHKPVHMKNPGDILIDDFVANVRRWEKAGGVAIKHYDGESTISKLEKILYG